MALTAWQLFLADMVGAKGKLMSCGLFFPANEGIQDDF